jgi:glutathione S-transferase
MATSSAPSASTASVPEEKVPDPAPLFAFFAPNFLGILFALGMERFQAESKLSSLLPEGSHPFALLGLGAFVLLNVNSYLAGSVVLARIEYGVKLPNLYATKEECKNATLFNTIQRSHQNFLEHFPQLVLSLLIMNTIFKRPHVSGLVLLMVSFGRIAYALGYQSKNVNNRLFGILLSIWGMAIGTGYAGIAALTLFGINLTDLGGK